MVAVYLRTFVEMGDFYLSSAVGGAPAWFQQNLFMPDYMVISLVLLLIASAVISTDDEHVIPVRHRFIYFSIFSASMIAAITSMFLGWTFNNENVIQGVQGRYFLPALALLLLAFRSPRIKAYARLNLWIPFLAYAINVAYLMTLSFKILG